MLVEGANMICGGETKTFIRLRHQIADVNLGRGGVNNGLGDSVNQQVRDKAGEQRAGTDGDQVG